MPRYDLIIPVVFAALLAGAAAVRAQVTVTRAEPQIERKIFDPRNPPPEMPKLNPNEAAVTQSFFGADARLGGNIVDQSRVGDAYQTSIKVDMVTVTLKMRVTVWLPRNATKKLTDHEEGHRRLAEHYYKDADTVARRLAEKLMGQTITGKATDYEAAGDKALKEASVVLGQKYLGETDIPSGEAQGHFDRITIHGTNAVSEEIAMKQAIEETAKGKPAQATVPTPAARGGS